MKYIAVLDTDDYIQEYLYKSLLEYKKVGGLQITQAKNCIINGTPIPDNATVCDIEQIRAEFINRYPKNYANEPELGGRSCVFSLNEVLQIIDKYTKGVSE